MAIPIFYQGGPYKKEANEIARARIRAQRSNAILSAVSSLTGQVISPIISAVVRDQISKNTITPQHKLDLAKQTAGGGFAQRPPEMAPIEPVAPVGRMAVPPPPPPISVKPAEPVEAPTPVTPTPPPEFDEAAVDRSRYVEDPEIDLKEHRKPVSPPHSWDPLGEGQKRRTRQAATRRDIRPGHKVAEGAPPLTWPEATPAVTPPVKTAPPATPAVTPPAEVKPVDQIDPGVHAITDTGAGATKERSARFAAIAKRYEQIPEKSQETYRLFARRFEALAKEEKNVRALHRAAALRFNAEDWDIAEKHYQALLRWEGRSGKMKENWAQALQTVREEIEARDIEMDPPEEAPPAAPPAVTPATAVTPPGETVMQEYQRTRPAREAQEAEMEAAMERARDFGEKAAEQLKLIEGGDPWWMHPSVQAKPGEEQYLEIARQAYRARQLEESRKAETMDINRQRVGYEAERLSLEQEKRLGKLVATRGSATGRVLSEPYAGELRFNESKRVAYPPKGKDHIAPSAEEVAKVWTVRIGDLVGKEINPATGTTFTMADFTKKESVRGEMGMVRRKLSPDTVGGILRTRAQIQAQTQVSIRWGLYRPPHKAPTSINGVQRVGHGPWNDASGINSGLQRIAKLTAADLKRMPGGLTAEEVQLVKDNLRTVKAKLRPLRSVERSLANATVGDIAIGENDVDYYLDKYKQMLDGQKVAPGTGATDYSPQKPANKAASSHIMGTSEFKKDFNAWLKGAWDDKATLGKVVVDTSATNKVEMWERSPKLRRRYWTEKLGHVESQISTLNAEKGAHPGHKHIRHIDRLLEGLEKNKTFIDTMLEKGDPPKTFPAEITASLGKQKETIEQYAMRVNEQKLPAAHKRRLVLARAAQDKELGVRQPSRIPLRDRSIFSLS